jgi:hypothetical protein
MGHIAALENLTKPDIAAALEKVPTINPKKGIDGGPGRGGGGSSGRAGAFGIAR